MTEKSKEETMISKFTEDSMHMLDAIIKRIQQLTEGKKDDEVIQMSVKMMKSLADDLKGMMPAEEPQEAPEAAKEAAKKKEEPAKTVEAQPAQPQQAPVAPAQSEAPATQQTTPQPTPEEKTAKQGETMEQINEVAKYQELIEESLEKLKEAEHLLGIKDEMIVKLETDNAMLKEEISKFREQSEKVKVAKFTELLEKTSIAWAKLANHTETERLAKKQEWMTSKMSDTALEQLGKEMDSLLSHKLDSQPRSITAPSEHLKGQQEKPLDFNSLSKKEQLAHLARVGAEAAKREGKFHEYLVE